MEKQLLALSKNKEITSKKAPACVGQALYDAILHGSKSSYSTVELSLETGVPYARTSYKLHQLKWQGWVKKNDDGTWSLGLK